MTRHAVTAPTPLAIRTPADRAVLIGTMETVRQARELLGMVDGAPEPIGCILIDTPRARAGGGLTVLGTLEDLPAAITARGITLAVVSLPMAMADTINRVRAVLREHGGAERFLAPLRDMLAQAPPFSVGLGTPASVGAGTGRLDIGELIGRSPRALDR